MYWVSVMRRNGHADSTTVTSIDQAFQFIRSFAPDIESIVIDAYPSKPKNYDKPPTSRPGVK